MVLLFDFFSESRQGILFDFCRDGLCFFFPRGNDMGGQVFNKGDMAVYPAHGVGEIQAVEKRVVGDREQSFYVMKIIDTSMVVMIPTTNSDTVGLRSIISPAEAERVFEILKERDVVIEAQPWNQRYRQYMEKIKTGSVFKIAGVLRDLYLLKEDKELSFGEKKMLDTAKNLLMKEIALANHIKEDQVEKDIEKIFLSDN